MVGILDAIFSETGYFFLTLVFLSVLVFMLFAFNK